MYVASPAKSLVGITIVFGNTVELVNAKYVLIAVVTKLFNCAVVIVAKFTGNNVVFTVTPDKFKRPSFKPSSVPLKAIFCKPS